MPRPSLVKLHQKRQCLELHFDDGVQFMLSCEYLRVYTPSAERIGHGAGQETLPVGKEHVGITAINPIGQYALQFVFTDGHDSGFYSWDYLYTLGAEQKERWQHYQDKVNELKVRST
jgi:Uncharacterized protein conserved in bacteria